MPRPRAGMPRAPPSSRPSARRHARACAPAPFRSYDLCLCERFAGRAAGKRLAEADDFPLQRDGRARLDARAYGLAETLDVLGGGAGVVDEEVAVHLRDL